MALPLPDEGKPFVVYATSPITYPYPPEEQVMFYADTQEEVDERIRHSKETGQYDIWSNWRVERRK